MQKRALTGEEIQVVLENLDSKLVALKENWDAIKPASHWFSWVTLGVNNLVAGVRFLIECLDHLIQYVEELIPDGKDKKVAVLEMAGKLYDYVIASNLPLWLMPVSRVLKKIIVDFFLSELIDFIVSKYNELSWKPSQGFGRK